MSEEKGRYGLRPPTGPWAPHGEEATGPVAPHDPWRHRAIGMRCGTCMFFVAKKAEVERDANAVLGELGRCRRHAPTMSGFPAVYEMDWCGDHKLDENKA